VALSRKTHGACESRISYSPSPPGKSYFLRVGARTVAECPQRHLPLWIVGRWSVDRGFKRAEKDGYSIMNHLRRYQVQERSNCGTRKGRLRRKCPGSQRTSIVTWAQCLVHARCYGGMQRHYGEDRALNRKKHENSSLRSVAYRTNLCLTTTHVRDLRSSGNAEDVGEVRA
jgi:hypothetical protein